MSKQWLFTSVIILGGLCLFALSHYPMRTFLVMCPNIISPNHSGHDREKVIMELLRDSETGYQLYMRRRKASMKRKGGKPLTYFPYYYLRPAFSCPYSTQRIGADLDGGKWICGFELYEDKTKGFGNNANESCIVYSFGGAYESSFEGEFLNRTNCKVFAFDGSVNGMGNETKDYNDRVKFSKTFVAGSGVLSGGEKTLGQLMKDNGHRSIDVLKMDIEGNEFRVLNQVMDEFDVLPFTQLQLEVHFDYKAMYDLWERMEEKGLRAFSGELNPYTIYDGSKKPSAYEYAFINVYKPSRLIPKSLRPNKQPIVDSSETNVTVV